MPTMPTMPKGQRGSGYALATLPARRQHYTEADHGVRCLTCQAPTIAAAQLDPPIHPTCDPTFGSLIRAAALAEARSHQKGTP